MKEMTDEDAAQAIARALADPQRWRILKELAAPGLASEGGMAPCALLREVVDVGAATLSHHMRELREAGLVEERRAGRTVRYRLRAEVVEAFMGVLTRDLLGRGEARPQSADG